MTFCNENEGPGCGEGGTGTEEGLWNTSADNG